MKKPVSHSEQATRVRRSLSLEERELINDLLDEIRCLPHSWSLEKLEANLYSLMPEVQLDDADVIYPSGHWRSVKVNRNPPPLVDIVYDLEQHADRFRRIRRQHGFEIECNYSRYPFHRMLVRAYSLQPNS